MKTLEMKQNLLDTINGIDERDTDLLEELIAMVRNAIRQNEWKKKAETLPRDERLRQVAGLWADDPEAEMMAKAIREGRLSNRTREITPFE